MVTMLLILNDFYRLDYMCSAEGKKLIIKKVYYLENLFFIKNLKL